MSETRICYYIPPDSYVEDKGFIPALVTENEPGYAPLTGRGEFAEPWYWGHTYEQAQGIAAEQNERLGLTPGDVNDIIISSMRAST
jgi:hypothetical protein